MSRLLPLALLAFAGCGAAGLDGSLTSVMDLSYDAVELRQTADEVAVAFVRKNGDTALQVTAALKDVTLAAGQPLNLAEKLTATTQRGVLSRNVMGDTTTRFPSLERGTLTLGSLPTAQGTVSGSFNATLVQGATEPYGRTVSGKFDAAVLQVP
ncbi:MAG: hypothetical protein IT380_26110 [Myxococcales bacterium]|nr:hypothetical protein [Myxococcales bacterium]